MLKVIEIRVVCDSANNSQKRQKQKTFFTKVITYIKIVKIELTLKFQMVSGFALFH